MHAYYPYPQRAAPAAYVKVLRKKQKQLESADNLKLKNLCLESIKRNVDFYIQQEQRTGISAFDDLPILLRMDMLGSHLDKWGKWEQLMMNSHVTNLALSLDLDKRIDDFVNFCASIAAHNPQIINFKCGGFYKNSRSKSLMPLHFIATTGYFKSLQSLTLTGTISTDDHLKTIATYLKHLRVLRLELEGVTIDKGIRAISTLEHLVEFEFTMEIRRDLTMLYNSCLQLMPRLEVIAEEINLETVDDKTEVLAQDFHVDFEALPKPIELGLRQLVLHRKMDAIPAEISTPNLTSLCLWGPLENFQLDATRFSKVTSLGLLDIGMENCLNTLKLLGRQITLLTILEEEEDLILDPILRLCPKLERFHIGKSPRNIIIDSPLEPDSDLQNLKELRLVLSNKSFMRGRIVEVYNIQFSPGALVQLLRAPRLRWLKLCQVNLSNEELKSIAKLVKKGQMLQKLKELEVDNMSLTRGSYIFKPWATENFERLLYKMAENCPEFIRCEFIAPANIYY